MLRADLNRQEGGYGGSRTRATQCRPERFTKAGLGFSLESVWNEDLDVFRNKDRSLRLSVLTLRSHVTNTCCVPDLLSRLRIQCFCPTIFIEFLPRAKSCTIRTLFREDFLLGGVPTCRGAETESPPPRRTPSHVATGRWSKAKNRHRCRIGKHAPPSSGFRRVFTNARFLSLSAVPATTSHLVIASSWPPRSAALPRRSSFVPTLPVSGSWSGPPQSAAVSFLITLG